MKKLLFLFCLLTTSLSSYATLVNTVEGIPMLIDPWDYPVEYPYEATTLGEGIGQWTSCIDPATTGSVTIPSQLIYQGKTYIVTRVAYWSFLDCRYVTSISVPETVRMWEAPFTGCSGLTTINIPSALESDDISPGLFRDSPNLAYITVGSNNTTHDSRNDCNAVIETATNKLVIGTKNTIIPSSVTSIGNGAFLGRAGLQAISIPSSITSIGNGAFQGCTGLQTITIPSSVTSIGASVFKDCTNLQRVISKNTVPVAFGENAFNGISSYCILEVPSGTKAAYEAAGWTEEIFKGGIVENQDIPSDGYTFTDTTIEGVLMTFKVISVANKTVQVGDGNSQTPCISTTYNGPITIPAQVELQGEMYQVATIQSYAFRSCRINSITIPEGVRGIGVQVFAYCNSLGSIYIPSSVTNLSNQAFSFCRYVNITVDPNNSVYDSRDNCNAVIRTADNVLWAGGRSTVIPESVTSIGNYAFYGRYITSITIPSNVTSIGNYAFNQCSALTSVVCKNEVPITLGTNMVIFSNINSGCVLHVPMGSKDAYIAAGWTTNFFKGGIVETPIINDKKVYTGSTQSNVAELTYNRTFNNTNWQALYVPFSMTYDDWKDDFEVARLIGYLPFYNLDGSFNEGKTRFIVAYVTSGELLPNHPYLIRAKTTGDKTITLTDAVVYPAEENSIDCSTTETLCTFTGTYSGVSNIDGYALGGGSFNIIGNQTLSPQRWYMTITSRGSQVNTTPASIKIRVIDEEDVPSAIEQIQAAQSQQMETGRDAYDLQGRRLNTMPTQPGTYIIGGKKVWIR